MAAFGAGSICTLLTNPLSVVRSRILLSDKNHGKGKYSTIGQTIVHIAKTEGIAGFYKVIIHIQSTIRNTTYNGLQKNWTFWERGKTFPLF